MMLDSAEFRFGDWFQRQLDRMLRERGWFTIASYDFAGANGDKAPRMYGARCGYPIPDIDAAKSGLRRWVEAKAKSKADWTWKKQRLEHGFSRRHYESYKTVQSETGTKVWVFVYEKETGDILYQKVDVLEQDMRVYEGDKMDRGGTVFFARDDFLRFGNIRYEDAA